MKAGSEKKNFEFHKRERQKSEEKLLQKINCTAVKQANTWMKLTL